jgi:xylulokinase
MSSLLGIDLGTSSVKVVVVSEEGKILGLSSAEYPILTPQPGFAVQNPEDWWAGTVQAIRGACAQAGSPDVKAVGFSGQMHGPLLMDRHSRPLGPAIIWADQRAGDLVSEISQLVGPELLTRAGTAPASGFMVATLLWLKRNDPEQLKQAQTALFPKDYLRFRLTGTLGTDQTDASASGLFDVGSRVWSEQILERLELPRQILPEPSLSAEIVGEIMEEAARETGLKAGTPVAAGAADQPCQAIGNGMIDPPLGGITVGTGGQVFVPCADPVTDRQLRFHTFCHAPENRWYLLGAMLSAGMALRWVRRLTGQEQVSFSELDQRAAKIAPGCEGLTFLPYLVGERAPIMDPTARAGFVGLTLRHTTDHLMRAVLEGVGYAFRQILGTMSEQGVRLDELVASGNGLQGSVWREMIADILGRRLLQGDASRAPERAGVGAALLGGIGTGVFSSFAATRSLAPKMESVTEPNPEKAAAYQAGYERFCDLYPRLKGWGQG